MFMFLLLFYISVPYNELVITLVDYLIVQRYYFFPIYSRHTSSARYLSLRQCRSAMPSSIIFDVSKL